MYQDPFDDICRRFMNILTYFVMLLALSVYYTCVVVYCQVILFYLQLKGVYLKIEYFLRKILSHVFIMYIEPWLIGFGLRREKTWTEIEQRRLEVSALCGHEIPRTPDLEEGLRQEGYL